MLSHLQKWEQYLYCRSFLQFFIVLLCGQHCHQVQKVKKQNKAGILVCCFKSIPVTAILQYQQSKPTADLLDGAWQVFIQARLALSPDTLK